ncbi:MAG: ribonuclease PH [Synergistaceae bacterium]|nr:ribonuclease PH [Synergistaceae bacterium]
MSPYRVDGRRHDELRPVSLERGVNRYAEGSAIIRWGNTVVHCTASVEDKVPSFRRGLGAGWLTAEYSMLPRATHDRSPRDVQRGRMSGRSSEIQRLIGRSMRAAVDLTLIGERTILIDCDVLQADGGTRTASITCAFVCLVDALRAIFSVNQSRALPLTSQVAAVSVGKVGGAPMLDLCYEEDSHADVDCNVVMTGLGDFVEFQGTGEGGFFSRTELDDMLRLASIGMSSLFSLQRNSLELSPQESILFDELCAK